MNAYTPCWWLPGGHVQTLWPVCATFGRIEVQRHTWTMPDGQPVLLEQVGQRGPIVIVLPGLQGDRRSHYVRATLRAIAKRGWRGMLLNHRGRGAKHLPPAPYHCAMTCDLDHVVRTLQQREAHTPLAVIGFSLGANILLKWLSEIGRDPAAPPIRAAAAISAPFHLGQVARRLECGLSRIYQHHLLKSLRRDVARQLARNPDQLKLTAHELRRLRTFYLFDDRITAPLHGFAGAEDYYARTRTDQCLHDIATPTLILNARNDPFIPAHLLPKHGELPDHVTLQITDQGGHLGFPTGRWPWRIDNWAAQRSLQFLESHLLKEEMPIEEPMAH